jgi:hypothetical protein
MICAFDNTRCGWARNTSSSAASRVVKSTGRPCHAARFAAGQYSSAP